jgi:NIMA (never in mitosis gene a)-related kinase
MHRDIKPANVFITGSGVMKLGDMGLGRQLSQESVAAFSKVGTPLYMSPELLKGDGYDMKSDIWSLGCVLVSEAASYPPRYHSCALICRSLLASFDCRPS